MKHWIIGLFTGAAIMSGLTAWEVWPTNWHEQAAANPAWLIALASLANALGCLLASLWRPRDAAVIRTDRVPDPVANAWTRAKRIRIRYPRGAH